MTFEEHLAKDLIDLTWRMPVATRALQTKCTRKGHQWCHFGRRSSCWVLLIGDIRGMRGTRGFKAIMIVASTRFSEVGRQVSKTWIRACKVWLRRGGLWPVWITLRRGSKAWLAPTSDPHLLRTKTSITWSRWRRPQTIEAWRAWKTTKNIWQPCVFSKDINNKIPQTWPNSQGSHQKIILSKRVWTKISIQIP